MVANLLHRGISQGGSTITQQLAKNLFLTQERNLMRKLQEVVLALWLEHKFSKNEILELYLNRVYFGSGAYGVEAAAQRYFGKSARNVTVAEAALLAGLVKSPSRLAPTRNFDGAERARPDRARRHGGRQAHHGGCRQGGDGRRRPRSSSPAPAAPRTTSPTGCMDVLNDLVGRVDEDIVVDTTIDAALQAVAEKALIEEIAQKGEKFGVEQGALVAMTPDGAVRALVGGRSYAESQFNRAVAAKRQPGSAFKPFVYLTALEHGLTPDTVREDRPIEVKDWRPENYGHEYFGPVTLTQALAHVAQHGVGAAHAGIRPDRRGAHRAPARHRLEARAQRLDRARHLGSLGAGAGIGLRAVRQWRHRRHAARRRAGAHRPRQDALCAHRPRRSAASSIRAMSR